MYSFITFYSDFYFNLTILCMVVALLVSRIEGRMLSNTMLRLAVKKKYWDPMLCDILHCILYSVYI